MILTNTQVVDRIRRVECMRDLAGDALADLWSKTDLLIENEEFDGDGELIAANRQEFCALAAQALSELAEQYDDEARDVGPTLKQGPVNPQ